MLTKRCLWDLEHEPLGLLHTLEICALNPTFNYYIDTGSSNAGIIGYNDPAVGDAYDRY